MLVDDEYVADTDCEQIFIENVVSSSVEYKYGFSKAVSVQYDVGLLHDSNIEQQFRTLERTYRREVSVFRRRKLHWERSYTR